MPKTIKGADFVRNRYQVQDIASKYENSRFNTLLGRLIHIQEIEAINKALCFHPSSLVEIATGPGRISKEIKLDTPAIGLDSSVPMLKLAKQNIQDEKWSFICGDAIKLPFHDESFHALITFHFVRHLTAPERARVFHEFSRVLRKDGVLIMDVLNTNRGVIATALDRVYRLAERLITGNKSIYDARHTKSGLQQELAEAGFELQSMNGVAHLYSVHFIFNLPFDLVRYIKQKYLRKDVGTFYGWVRDKFLSVALRIECTQNRDKGYLWVATCAKKQE